MAHIVSCMLEGNQDSSSLSHYVSKPASPQLHHDPEQPQQATLQQQQTAEKASSSEKSFVWRMYQPERKYQLFPSRDKQQQAAPAKGLDPEQAFAHAMGQSTDKTEKSSAGGGLRVRIKEHNLNRRRKVSVPELGPMTTVQEVPMDSPTIPGRPPLHERSISAPGHGAKHHHLAEVMVSMANARINENAELSSSYGSSSNSGSGSLFDGQSSSSARPLSPKSLAPLVIPIQGSVLPKLTRQRSVNRIRSGSTPLESSSRSARTDDSPKMRTPYTPLSGGTNLTTPKSAATAMTASTLPTPVSATTDARSSPKPWSEVSVPGVTTPQEKKGSSFFDEGATPKGVSSEVRPQTQATVTGHRRNQSESSGSIMERGRPRKRCDIIPGGISIGGTASKRSKSADRRAFETLPKGWKASEAIQVLDQDEAVALQKQALQQAARFEVLKKEDVESLSRELRQLDERTEYLRRTYASLRAGRRNLHSRICQYLRSPRVAKFSHDSMLKQEEALAELDVSIDDWVGKLEQAENRRTRVRQKLLEHVAAAATMPLSPGSVKGVSESLQMAIGIRPPSSLPAGSLSTPPRSPTRQPYAGQHSPTPQRVPSTIMEQPLGEEMAGGTGAGLGIGQSSPPAADEALRRADIQSIRIYAGDDVYALLADVENEFTKMSGAAANQQPMPPSESNLSDDERKELHRAQSHELLNGLSKKSSANSMSSTKSNSKPSSPVMPTAPKESATTFVTAPVFVPTPSSASTGAAAPVPSDDGAVFLTSAVFKP